MDGFTEMGFGEWTSASTGWTYKGMVELNTDDTPTFFNFHNGAMSIGVMPGQALIMSAMGQPLAVVPSDEVANIVYKD